jgi:hypothetical protein
MPSKSLRLCLVFFLGLAASSSSVRARPLDGSFVSNLPSLWRRVIDGLVEPRLASSAPKDGERGCTIDPNGQPVCAPKRGCTIDPNGQPVCTP